ncbi:hypothetical protein [Mariprofundus micogutta]|uniref:hypothetical protein n=1 Tax=Mariprofundus micogutta TaxID=1921010 RepID=UPI0009334F90|nr:hypothetical protein [Mariprofundus micogutta]
MKKGKLVHSFLRQFVLLTLLLSSTLPSIQTVFACDFMDGKVQTVCCCEGPEAMMDCETGGGGCDTNEAIPASGCCEVTDVYQPVLDAVALPGSHSFQLLMLDAPQPPPVLLSSLLSHGMGVRFQDAPFLYSFPPWGSGTNTYLLTSRLRI